MGIPKPGNPGIDQLHTRNTGGYVPGLYYIHGIFRGVPCFGVLIFLPRLWDFPGDPPPAVTAAAAAALAAARAASKAACSSEKGSGRDPPRAPQSFQGSLCKEDTRNQNSNPYMIEGICPEP